MNRSQKVFGLAWLVLVALTLWGSSFEQLAALHPLLFPDDFHDWTKLTSIRNKTGSHDIYLKPNALTANREKGIYPAGSKLLVVSHTPNSRQVTYTLMVKDAQIFEKTSGWAFATFDANHARQKNPGQLPDFLSRVVLRSDFASSNLQHP